jgi:hypothetical protein
MQRVKEVSKLESRIKFMIQVGASVGAARASAIDVDSCQGVDKNNHLMIASPSPSVVRTCATVDHEIISNVVCLSGDVQDVFEMRQKGWRARRVQEGPKKIEDVHREAARELEAQAQRDMDERRSGRRGGDRGPPGPPPRGGPGFDRLMSKVGRRGHSGVGVVVAWRIRWLTGCAIRRTNSPLVGW